VALMDDFDALYAAHFTSLTTQLFAYIGDREEAQDVVQEAFCRAWARWRQVSTYDQPVGWVRRVAWNLATSNLRRARVAARFRRGYQPVHVAPPTPDRVALVAALKAVPVRQRQATVLHYLTDLPIAEIAAAMEVSEGTVKSWLHRARATLARRLDPARPA
jgi:RNA polymerase sigma-70 factor (ECF subfamily)